MQKWRNTGVMKKIVKSDDTNLFYIDTAEIIK